MSASRAAKRPEPDQRLLVLLFAGLLLCLGPLLSRNFTLPKSEEGLVPPAYLWLGGAGLEEGLYRLAPGWQEETASRSSLAELPLTPDFPERTAFEPAAFRLQDGEAPVVSRPPAGLAPLFFAPIRLNQADRELLMTLPGIGPRLADAIIALRQQKKRFQAMAELLEVKGIGKGKIAKLEGRVSFD